MRCVPLTLAHLPSTHTLLMNLVIFKPYYPRTPHPPDKFYLPTYILCSDNTLQMPNCPRNPKKVVSSPWDAFWASYGSFCESSRRVKNVSKTSQKPSKFRHIFELHPRYFFDQTEKLTSSCVKFSDVLRCSNFY